MSMHPFVRLEQQRSTHRNLSVVPLLQVLHEGLVEAQAIDRAGELPGDRGGGVRIPKNCAKTVLAGGRSRSRSRSRSP